METSPTPGTGSIMGKYITVRRVWSAVYVTAAATSLAFDAFIVHTIVTAAAR